MFNLFLNLYIKFRNYIVDVIRSRNIPADKWKKTIIIRKIMRIFLFVLPLLIYSIIALILWLNIDMTKILNIIFIVVAIVGFFGLLYLILKFKQIIKNYIIEDYEEHFRNIGLTNKQGNTPIFRKMKYDKNVSGKEIYYFDDVDVDYGKFNEPVVIRGLRNIFRGYVTPSEGNMYGQFRFYVIPSCKSSCRQLTINDTWLVQNIIHLGIFGRYSVVGKTVAIAYFLYLYCLYVEANSIDMEITICDQKMTFAKRLGVEKSKSFHYGLDVLSAIEQICANFEQIKLNPDGKIRIIVCDEYISLVDKLPPKEATHLKLILGALIFESREYNYHIILARTGTDTQKDFQQVFAHLLQIRYY